MDQGELGYVNDEDGAVYHELCSPPPPWFRENLFAETFFICSRARDARQEATSEESDP